MAILWTEDLATGSTEIDNQHKAIFDRINVMLDACNQGKGKQEVNGVVSFLEDYVVSHFRLEELYMVRYRYHDYVSHKAEHEEFIGKLTKLRNKVQTERIGVDTVIAVNQLVVSWFVSHIRRVDTKLGSFLKEGA